MKGATEKDLWDSVTYWRDLALMMRPEFRRTIEERDAYKEALEFYAKDDNWRDAYREASEFYAKDENWIYDNDFYSCRVMIVHSDFEDDPDHPEFKDGVMNHPKGGKRARETLQRFKKEGE